MSVVGFIYTIQLLSEIARFCNWRIFLRSILCEFPWGSNHLRGKRVEGGVPSSLSPRCAAPDFSLPLPHWKTARHVRELTAMRPDSRYEKGTRDNEVSTRNKMERRVHSIPLFVVSAAMASIKPVIGSNRHNWFAFPFAQLLRWATITAAPSKPCAGV